MPLAAGSKIGPYEIISPLGAGGMGEVYRARDAKLQRDVAIKVLPDLFAQDAERLARFEREARTLAALNHPNIAAIYGIEGPALIMELVEGEDLSLHIARGAIPLVEALPIARQIADALEAAHEAGIVHRDLKPANIKVRENGAVKVLDFGLAKALDANASGASAEAMNSPTLTARATQMGMIIGTAAYMAPEQAKGRAVDRRADIWAFGVVLFEMLTGRRAFAGDDVSDVLASVLKTEPDWSALPANLPPSIRRLLRRCLEKDPRMRLGAISDARLELNETEPAVAAPVASQIVVVRPSLIARLWPAGAGIVVTAAIATLLWPARTSDGSAVLTRESVLAPPGVATGIYPDSAQVAISPDGTMVAFVVGDFARDSDIWVRSLDSLTARRLEGSDGGHLPFWSPDSHRLGFFTGGKLKVMAVVDGHAEAISDAPGRGGRGASWSASNVIVFARDATGPLYVVSANGGDVKPVTTLDAGRKQSGHRFPVFLPDGDHFLYAALPAREGKFDIFAGSLHDSTTTLVGSMESAPVYAPSGWLLYARQGILAAQPFDARALKATGEAVSLGDEPTSVLDPATSFTAGYAVSVSTSGSLAYYSTPPANTQAVWFDASGKPSGTLALPPGRYSGVTISPDATHAVVEKSISVTESSLWLVDLTLGSAVPLSSGRGRNDSPVWSPDSARVVFCNDRDGAQNFFVKNVTGSSPEQPLYQSPALFKGPTGWSKDGRWIVFTQVDPTTAQNIYLLPADGKGEPHLYLQGPHRDAGGMPSPDGHWLAYISDDTGHLELYVQSFPEAGRQQQISTEGVTAGGGVGWTRDSRHLVFVSGDDKSLWRVDVEPGTSWKSTTPVRVARLPAGTVAMDVMPDGQRFLALAPERAGTGSVTVVQNWRAALDKKR